MIRHVLFSSFIRNSWQCRPMFGIRRDCGRARTSPCCNRRSRNPVSRRADSDIGGVLISPRRIISALPFTGEERYIRTGIIARPACAANRSSSTASAAFSDIQARYLSKFVTGRRRSVGCTTLWPFRHIFEAKPMAFPKRWHRSG